MSSSPVVTLVPLINCPPNKLPLPRLSTSTSSSAKKYRTAAVAAAVADVAGTVVGSSVIGSPGATTCLLISSPRTPRQAVKVEVSTPRSSNGTPTAQSAQYCTPKTACGTGTGGRHKGETTSEAKKPVKRLEHSAEAQKCKRRIDFAYAGLSKAKCESIARRNARERNRVKQVNNGFDVLREHLPLDAGIDRSKLSKVETLRSAVSYIQHLQAVLRSDDSRRHIDAMKVTFAAASNPVHPAEDGMQYPVPISSEGGTQYHLLPSSSAVGLQYPAGGFSDLLMSPAPSSIDSGMQSDGAEWTSDSPPPEYMELPDSTTTEEQDLLSLNQWLQ